MGRLLPVGGVVCSLSVWWMIWSPAEEITCPAYALQHSLLPFLPDWRCVLWRFLAFVPGVTALMLIYLKTRRLPPLIVAHRPMDIVGALMTRHL